LANIVSNVAINESVQSVCKIKHNKLIESPVVGPCKSLELAKGLTSTADMDIVKF